MDFKIDKKFCKTTDQEVFCFWFDITDVTNLDGIYPINKESVLLQCIEYLHYGRHLNTINMAQSI